ncbi:MAG: S8 family serine peptidase [Flavobacteriales bacterium]
MKRLLLSIVAVGFTAIGTAQTVYDNCQDGKIWFKIKDDYVMQKNMTMKGQEDRRSEMQKALDELPFLANVISGFQVTNVSAPFAHFKAPKLKITYQIDFSDYQKVDEIIRVLQNHPAIEYAERVPLDKKTFTPNDPAYPAQQWGLTRIQASLAWAQSLGSANIVIAVVDDAVDIDHPDLMPIRWVNTGEIPGNGIDDDGNGYIDDVHGANVATSTPSQQGNPRPGTPLSSFDHGTHVAGIACAATNNGIGIASIGAGVRLMSVRAANTSGSLTSTLQGVLYAIENGANVINMSYGSSFFSATYQNAITFGHNQGVVMVAACGNNNVNTLFYPAGYANVISVAASQGTDAKASFSNYDNGTGWVDLCAPGTSIYSTIPVGLGSYGNKQGTSMASPLVAGLCGLMLSMNPSLTPADVENCLKTTCDPATGAFAPNLGAGRINANNAMACVAATLNWAPQADFVANITTITAGGSVNFTNLSIYNPTSYSWTFTGGTPATSTAVNPQNIVYNTPGTYAVSLTATNANGSDTETKTAYITVNPNTGCTQITNTLPGDTIYTYTFGGPGSYLGGTNTQGVIAYAESFQSALFPAGSYIQNAMIYFVRGQSTNPNDMVQIRIWNQVAGLPGTIVYTQNTPLSEIVANQTVPGNPNAFYPTIVEFDVPYQITGNFYIGITVPQPTPLGQEYAIAYTHNFLNDATGRTNKAFLQMQAGNPLGAPAGWYAFDNFFQGNPRQSMHIYLRTTQHPVQANIVANTSPVCAGNSISYSNSTPNNVVQNEWYVNGVTGGYSTLNNPSFIYNNPGTYKTYLVANNQCGYYAIDSVDVTVNPTPQLNLTPIDPLICPGGSIGLAVSGAATYAWSPAAGLSATTGANVTASPVSTTTYTVAGTQGGCSSSSEVTVYVEQPPVADFLFTPGTNICYNQPVFFDGPVLSEDATGYSWVFTGGTPATSTNPTEMVTFPGPGTYNVTLTVNNNCSQTDSETIAVTVDNCDFLGLSDLGTQLVQGYLNPVSGELHLTMLNVEIGKYDLTIYNILGAIIQSEQLVVSSDNQQFQLPLLNSATGVYIVKISKGERIFSFRISK